MPDQRYGGAADAAEILGRGVSQFNEMRRRNTYVLEPRTGSLRRLEESSRADARNLHLVAPSFAGQRLPGGSWEYDLERLRSIREGDYRAAVPLGPSGE